MTAVILTVTTANAFSLKTGFTFISDINLTNKVNVFSSSLRKNIQKKVVSSVEAINNIKIKQQESNGVERPKISFVEEGIGKDVKIASTKIVNVETVPVKHTNIVPFTSQAPRGRWVLPYSEACEEASLIMINAFLNGENLNTVGVETDIKSLVAWETERGYTVDIGTAEIADVIANFYGRSCEIYSGKDVSIEKMKALLSGGTPIIVPVAGQKLGNVNFIGAGPPYHVVAVVGYDDTYFYTHDPGTRNGKEYKYEINKFFDAIHDWNGSKKTVLDGEKRFIIMK